MRKLIHAKIHLLQMKTHLMFKQKEKNKVQNPFPPQRQSKVHFFFFFFAIFFRATLVAYRNSQARGRIKAAAAGLHNSHSNAGSEPWLQPTPQLKATPDA